MKRWLLILILSVCCMQGSMAQEAAAKHWADSVYKTLSKDERIAQLMVVRLSTIDSKTKVVTFFDDQVADLVKRYNIGGVCLFQGSPVKQAMMINSLQAMARTPIMMCIDAEWGLGMRMTDSIIPLPKQMMLGAMKDPSIVYRYGKIVAEQCKRIGIQVNYAPVVDVNNNPNNPVINDRSFGEDKYKVADFGVAYMKGMQDAGVMACAKHFPGHGDVSTDSHYDLPVINKSITQLDSLELYPFRKIFAAGVGSVMVAHLYIPSIDNTPNRATSLSPQNVNGLMRNTLHYNGLTFTDALEMQGVKKFYPNGAASVQSLIAGNDMLCLPGDVPLSIAKIKEAIKKKKLKWSDIEAHCLKVLEAKYNYGLANLQPINTDHLTDDINKSVPGMRREVAENAITLVSAKNNSFFPLKDNKENDIAFVGIGISAENDFAKRIKADYNAAQFYFDANASYDEALIKKISAYKKIVIGIHGLGRYPANNFGLTKDMVSFANALQKNENSISFIFGNAYALKNFCAAPNAVVCYEDDAIIQNTAADLLEGKIFYKGVLPVTVCESFKYGFGIETKTASVPFQKDSASAFHTEAFLKIDSAVNAAIDLHAIPGAALLALKDGKIMYEKAYGFQTYEDNTPVNMYTVYDLASLTKICATTLCIMKLYEEGKLDLKKNLSSYLPETIGTNKEKISIEKLLLHEAGLEPTIFFYKETLDASGKPLATLYSATANDSMNVKVANHLFLKNSWEDTIYHRLLMSKRGSEGKYVYSDNDFIFLAKVAERITGEKLDRYTEENFYSQLGLRSTGFDPLERNFEKDIAPTENEKDFRSQLLRGYVHDQGAAIMGGVAGHAGLFSDAYDLGVLMQMLLNGGNFNGKEYFKKETVELFTAYHSEISRRGYGFDKPEKDNDTRKEPYPSKFASARTFGHTGFTGTCAWVDPAKELVCIFLSNRVYPTATNNILLRTNLRGKLIDYLYEAIN